MAGARQAPDRTGWAGVIATAMLTNPAGVLGAVTPAIIGGFVAEANIPLAGAARLVAIEFAAMTLATMAAPLVIGRVKGRLFASVALAVTLAGQIFSSHADMAGMMAARAAMGLGEGALYGFALAMLGRTPRPDRAFGIVVFSNQIVSAILLALAGFAHALHPASGTFLLMTLFLIATGATIPLLPADPIGREIGQGAVARSDWPAMVPAFVGIFLFAASFGALWPMVSSIGSLRGLGQGAVAAILSAAGIAGILGAAAAILLADRAGRTLPLVAGSVGMAFAYVGTVWGPIGMAGPAILGLWSFLVPYYLGAAAAADRGGRLVALAGAMLPSGIAAGQAFVSILPGRSGFDLLGMAATAAIVAGLSAMMLLGILSRRAEIGLGEVHVAS